jgi:trimeric autotransporter adhesin
MRRQPLSISVLMVILIASLGWSAPQDAAASGTPTAPGGRLVTFTGFAKGADGTPRTGSVALTFALYAAPEGGTRLWQETQTVVADGQGRYSVLLGSTTEAGLPVAVLGDGKGQWLGVEAEGEAELPRVLLVAVPYALKAVDADTLGGKPVASFILTENLTKAIKEQVTLGTLAGATTAAAIGGVTQLGHETDTNTWFGLNAGAAGPTGINNAFFGANAGKADASGADNVFVGYNSGAANASGDYNVFVGSGAGASNTVHHDNTFVGKGAGAASNTDYNTFVGSAAGRDNTTGNANVFVGAGAGLWNTTSSNSTYVGFQAGTLATGSQNTMVGANTGWSTTGSNNAFFGHYAGNASAIGSENSFFGAEAGKNTNTGYWNVFVGADAGRDNTTGDSNAFVGRHAGYTNTLGYENTFVGHTAGDGNTVESGNTFLGAGTKGATSVSSATAVGFLAQVTRSNALVLGAVAGVNGAAADTNVGIGTTAPVARLHVGSGEVRLANGNGTSSHFNYLNTSVNYVRGTTYFDGGAAYFTGGNVGIGTTSPVARLQVAGGELRLANGNGSYSHLNYANTSVNYVRGVTYFDSAPAYFTGGNVGIGTAAPAAKLHVVGAAIITGGVTTSIPEPVPDYVFEPGYTPMPLGEVERFVQREKHLPYVPSAAVLERDGINLAGLQMGLLRQVEELTLHTVDQAKQLAQQATTLANKDAQIEALSARVATLEALVRGIVRQEK